jgi:hypothetical protein
MEARSHSFTPRRTAARSSTDFYHRRFGEQIETASSEAILACWVEPAERVRGQLPGDVCPLGQ